MPEGHTVHRLARALGDLFGGQRLACSSPQGRFADGAALIDGMCLLVAEAFGKHLFLGVAPAGPDPTHWVHVHLGLYGSWTFTGDEAFARHGAIGAPRRRIGERLSAPADVPGQARGQAHGQIPGQPPGQDAPDWRETPPRGAVRLRIAGDHGLADLTGPTRCEVLTGPEKEVAVARIGPDPLRPDADPRTFTERVLRSTTPIGIALMNQEFISGVGNIYRAEVLFRAGLDPFMPGRGLRPGIVRGLWDDLVILMDYGLRTGRIVTTEPAHRDIHPAIHERTRQNGDDDPGVVPRERSFYVYHRQRLPCRICDRPVLTREVAGRQLFWCGRCQIRRVRRRVWRSTAPW